MKRRKAPSIAARLAAAYDHGFHTGHARGRDDEAAAQKAQREALDIEARRIRLDALQACATMADAVAHAIVAVTK